MTDAPFKPITREEAAHILSVSLRAIDYYVKVGVLPPPVPLGGRRKYWLPEVFYTRLRHALGGSTAIDKHTFTEASPRHAALQVRKQKRTHSVDSTALNARSKNQAKLTKLNRR